jgi:hypothetical protein
MESKHADLLTNWRFKMETVQIKDLPKGEFFKRKPDANKVYQRDTYNREANILLDETFD